MTCRFLLALSWFVGSVLAQAPATADATSVVQGRVVDMRGDGVPAARVGIVAYGALTPTLARAIADGEGYFRMDQVPDHPALQVHAEADGYCTGVEFVGSTRRRVTVTMQHAVVVRGVLKNCRGDPVPDVVVRADPHCRSLTYVHCDARTDREGRFAFPAVPLAPMHFAAWVEGEGLARLLQHVGGPCEIALQPNETNVTDLAVTIEGLPVDAEPVALSLLPYRDGRLSYLPPPYDRPRFDAQGHWQLAGVPDCNYTLYPSSTSFAFSPPEARVRAGKGPHKVRFTATPLGAAKLVCRAVVRDAVGQPVSGLPFRMRAPNGGAVAASTSDAEGRLEFASPLAAGAEAVIYTTHDKWVVDQDKHASRPLDRRSLKQHEFRVDPEGELTLRVVAGCSVHGRLLLASGQPAAFVDIELQAASANLLQEWMAMSWTTTTRDGTFRFVGQHHLADAVRLHVEAREGSFDGDPFHLAEPGAVHAAGELKLRAPAAIDGEVRDAQQRPLPGVRVWLRDWNFARNRQSTGRLIETLTDRDGRYRFVGVPVGGAWLQLLTGVEDRTGGTRAVEPFDVEAGKRYSFDLQEPGK